jgi:hypothetical protein
MKLMCCNIPLQRCQCKCNAISICFRTMHIKSPGIQKRHLQLKNKTKGQSNSSISFALFTCVFSMWIIICLALCFLLIWQTFCLIYDRYLKKQKEEFLYNSFSSNISQYCMLNIQRKSANNPSIHDNQSDQNLTQEEVLLN